MYAYDTSDDRAKEGADLVYTEDKGVLIKGPLERNVVEKANKFIESYLAKNSFSMVSSKDIRLFEMAVYKKPPGFLHPLHSDLGISCVDGELLHQPFVFLIYLNEDFGGGELFFPTQNYTITPKTGTAVIFPIGYIYPHTVFMVTEGQRYYLRAEYVFVGQES